MSVYPIRRLRLQHAFNVRDLGGYETSGGSYTRWNVLYRADGLSGLDDKEWNILKEAGIRTVIDLRSKSEAQEQPEQVPEPIQYYHCPLQEEQISMGDIEASALAAFTQSLDEGYRMMVKNNGSLIAAALRTLIGGLSQGAVVFHCTAGKDRTGTLAALLLACLGVSEEDITADYQISYTLNRRGINRMMEEMPGMEHMFPMLKSDPDTMIGLLEYIRELDLNDYLLRNGLTADELEQLKKYCLAER
ncbi:tyrosine-protein phosphatase [Diplocloster modestus]|uniref:Tyrosine-protein phosphatase n=1 Tax=Diplocloster modestus TaxID=2850322 RepID=A0ABS6K993_9FIRM|nr:tyrosine-protein phosphatase [Diplocloster modestus]MBU9727072.1 tyrosine-protein phosphatase [Diplocloster modestus]